MSGPTRLESKAAFVAKKCRISPVRVLEAMREWSSLSSDEKARHRLPETDEWTSQELETLRELWGGGALPCEVLEALPDRSYSAITQRARKEGIYRPSDYISEIRAAQGRNSRRGA